jgi:starch-binding outer membrane protein, SusD/RagB family
VPANIPADHALTKDQFRMKIFEERGLELLGEGQRWFDLVRMQHPTDPTRTMYEYQFLEELTKTKYPKKFPVWQAAKNQWSNSFAVYENSLNVTVPKFLLFPLPTDEVLQNPSIGLENQNPGW